MQQKYKISINGIQFTSLNVSDCASGDISGANIIHYAIIEPAQVRRQGNTKQF